MELIVDEALTAKKDVHFLPCKIHFDGPSKFKEYVMINKDSDTERKHSLMIKTKIVLFMILSI